MDLQYCDDDVYQTRDRLIDDFGWDTANVKLLIDSQATYSNILAQLDWMNGQEDEDSQVYFHFSGHGDTGIMLVYDGTMTDNTLANKMGAMSSKERVVVSDSCRAGSYTALDQTNQVTILACQSNQYSYDGMFTPKFINAMNSDSVSVESAFNTAKSQTNSATGGAQTPVMWDNVPGEIFLGNQPPVITPPVPDFSADEDNPITMTLTSHETDSKDTGINLKWSVTSHDGGVIAGIVGENSADDTITITPQPDFAGTTTIELTLSDSGGRQDSQNVQLTWNQINDAPSIASLEKSSTKVLRMDSVTIRVLGSDPEDVPAQIDALIEASQAGEDEWFKIGDSRFVNGKWEATYNPGIDALTGMYDVRAKLKDSGDLESDWLTRTSYIEVKNNRPVVDDISRSLSQVERARPVNISVYAQDIETPEGGMLAEVEYKSPVADFAVIAGTSSWIDDHYEVTWIPETTLPLGWYDIRARVKDVDEEYSSWYYENGSMEIVNSRPIVQEIVLEIEEIPRGQTASVSVFGFDVEDPMESLTCYMEYQTPSGVWSDFSTEITFGGSHWSVDFQPDSESELGDYTFRARLVDSVGEIGDFLIGLNTIEVTNNKPVIEKVTASDDSVVRTEMVNVEITASDFEDRPMDLACTMEMQEPGSTEWKDDYITQPEWDVVNSIWKAGFTPTVHAKVGDYGLRVVCTDLDEDSSEIVELDPPLPVENGVPIARFETEAVVNENEQVTFDGSSSTDAEGGTLTYAWDFGDGGTADGNKASHAFKDHGEYTVTLTVKDSDGAKSTLQQSIIVNALPAGEVGWYQQTGIANYEVVFDSSKFKDPDGKIVAYKWDLDLGRDSDGDGNPENDVDSTSRNPVHNYGGQGKYEYALTVVDDRGGETRTFGEVNLVTMTGTMMGILGGIFLLIIIAAVVAVIMLRRKKRGQKPSSMPHVRAEPVEAGYGGIERSQSYAPVPEDSQADDSMNSLDDLRYY
jgi:PKD repeat protein